MSRFLPTADGYRFAAGTAFMRTQMSRGWTRYVIGRLVLIFDEVLIETSNLYCATRASTMDCVRAAPLGPIHIALIISLGLMLNVRPLGISSRL